MIEFDTVQQAYAAWNRRDVEALLALMHPDVEIQPLAAGVTSVGPWKGHEGVRRLVTDTEARWDRFEMRCDDVVEFGDERILVFVHVTTAAGGEHIVVHGNIAHVIEFSDGLVTKLVAYRDREAAAAAAQA